jgi:predicted RNase H-like HicB family nuclease
MANANTPESIGALVSQPWTITVERDAEDHYLVARVAEIPDAIATGDDERSLMRDLWDAIATSLMARIDHGEEPPVPQSGTRSGHSRRTVRSLQQRTGSAWQVRAGRVAAATTLIGPGSAVS